MYRTTARYGTLTTSGHSTNFIMMVSTPLPDEVAVLSTQSENQTAGGPMSIADERCSSNHWIKRGAALITQLNY